MQGQLVMEELVLCLPQPHQTVHNRELRPHIHLQGIHLQSGRLGCGAALIGWAGQAHRAVGALEAGKLLWSEVTSQPARHSLAAAGATQGTSPHPQPPCSLCPPAERQLWSDLPTPPAPQSGGLAAWQPELIRGTLLPRNASAGTAAESEL